MEAHRMAANVGLVLATFTVLWIPSSAMPEEIHGLPVIPQDPKKRYDDWLAKHGKVYGSKDEYFLRFGIYQTNVQLIDFINSQNLSFKLTDNKFADITNNEYRARYLGFQAKSHRRSSPKHENYTDLPAEVDWRKKQAVTPVKDQGQCGTVYLFVNLSFHVFKRNWFGDLGNPISKTYKNSERYISGVCPLIKSNSTLSRPTESVHTLIPCRDSRLD